METHRPYTKTEQVLTTMTKEDRDRLDALAAKVPTSRADLARTFILDGIERDEAKRAARADQ